jgi:hypothetical protein
LYKELSFYEYAVRWHINNLCITEKKGLTLKTIYRKEVDAIGFQASYMFILEAYREIRIKNLKTTKILLKGTEAGHSKFHI